MKSPFRKVRGLGLHKHDKRNRHHQQQHQPSFAQSDELSHASQDMQDMRDCYDSLLSAAAGTTNNAYEFSESLQEMGGCLLEKTALTDDEDGGRVLLMLGKVQFNIQKLLDNYRSHIAQTITVPSESLLNELRIVEDMKRECDEKRTAYEAMKIQHDKGRLKNYKGEHVSFRQLQLARDEFDEAATLFIFRMKSLKSSQSRSLLTQAARHYAAQMCFFRKSLKSLEAIEPQVKLTTEQQHIDYNFIGLEDDDTDSVFLTDDDDEEEDDSDKYDTIEDKEVNIASYRNVQKNEVSTKGNSMELDNEDVSFPPVPQINSEKVNTYGKPLWNPPTYDVQLNKGSKSAPLSIESNLDPNERYRQMRQSSVRKLNTYALPTPLGKNSVTSQTKTQQPQPKPPTNNIWHSMPLEKISGKPTPLPAPKTEVLSQIDPRSSSSAKKIERYAFSGPISGDPQSNKSPLYASGPIYGSRLHTTLTQPSPTLKASASVGSFPKISELHELPRPPAKVVSKKPSRVGFSEPLVTFKREPDLKDANKLKVSDAVFMLPIPSRTQRDPDVASKQIESWDLGIDKAMLSPPLSPITFKNIS